MNDLDDFGAEMCWCGHRRREHARQETICSGLVGTTPCACRRFETPMTRVDRLNPDRNPMPRYRLVWAFKVGERVRFSDGVLHALPWPGLLAPLAKLLRGTIVSIQRDEHHHEDIVSLRVRWDGGGGETTGKPGTFAPAEKPS